MMKVMEDSRHDLEDSRHDLCSVEYVALAT